MGRLCARERVDRPKVVTRIRIRPRPIPPAPSTSARTTPATGPISKLGSDTMATSISSLFYCDWQRNVSGMLSLVYSIFFGWLGGGDKEKDYSSCQVKRKKKKKKKVCFGYKNVVSSLLGRRIPPKTKIKQKKNVFALTIDCGRKEAPPLYSGWVY